ncbi:hypothetical protein F25303_12336 [Fusarium sp. NRRL 25303]|nr:hypothetical protein F25303_12336 [Fusarium sp. NRRL 25303]
MAPRPHDPNLSEDIQPLIKVDDEVLTGRMDEIVTTVSELEERTVLIYVSNLNKKMRAKGISSHQVATIWGADPECHRIVHDFNTGNIDVLITTYATLRIPGPEYRGECHRGFLLETPNEV